MRIDLYTKTILTIIALLLAVFTLKPFVQPQAAMAQGCYAGIQFSYSGATTRFSTPTPATFGNMAITATFATTTKSMNLARTTGVKAMGREPQGPDPSLSVVR